MSASPDRRLFEDTLGDRFEVLRDGDSLAMLVSTDVEDGGSSAVRESFAVRFRGDLDVSLPQATYRLRHASEGELDLFIVPVGRDAEGIYYEAVFNRLSGSGDRDREA